MSFAPMEKFSADNMTILANVSYETAKAALNLICFRNGTYASFVFDSFTDPAGGVAICSIANPNLREIASVLDEQTQVPTGIPFETLRLALENQDLAVALDELVNALATLHQAPSNCARAIEGIRNVLSPSANTAQAWIEFRKALRIDESALRFITDQSKGPRHGDRSQLSTDAVGEMTHISWQIATRFITYFQNVCTPLDESEYLTYCEIVGKSVLKAL